MDYGHGLGANPAIRVDMGHYVMAQLFFHLGGVFVIYIVNMRLHLRDLLVGNGKAQFLFRSGQGNPKLAPGGKFVVRRKDIKHFPAGIAGSQRAFVDVLQLFIPP